MNGKIGTIKESLEGYSIEAVTSSQQEKMDAGKGRRVEYADAYRNKNKEFVNYLAEDFMTSMKVFQDTIPQAVKNPQYLLSREFQDIKNTFIQRYEKLVILLVEVQKATDDYLQEATKGYQEIQEIFATNKKKWYDNMQESLRKATDPVEKAKIQERIDLTKDIDQISEFTNMLG